MARATAATAAPRSVSRRTSSRAALVVSSFGAFLAFLDVTVVNVAFPSIRQSFPRASLSDVSWVLNSYNIVFAATLVAAGRFADLIGRRRLFHLGLFVFTLASAWCAASTSVVMLVVARAAQGFGAALIVPASLALVIEAFPAERRARAVGLWSATAAVASGLGPPVGGALVQAQSWRLAFLINVPLGVAALVAGRRVLVESRAPGRRTLPDIGGTVLQGLAMALLTLAIVEGRDWGWGSIGVVGAFAGSAAAIAVFVMRSRRHPVPVLDPKLLRIPAFAVASVVTAVAGMGFYAYMLNNILWLNKIWGYGLLRSGLAVAPGALVAAIVTVLVGKVADKWSHRFVVVPGALIWASAYVWYAQSVGLHPAFLRDWLPGQILSGIGVGATLPILASAALSAVPGGRFAGASAIVSSTRQIGAVLGVSLLVVVLGSPGANDAAGAFRNGWRFSAACFVVVAIGALFLRRPDRTLESAEVRVGAPLIDVIAPPELEPAGRRDATSLLARLPGETRQLLLDGADVVHLLAGEHLFRVGDAADALYVVRSGRVEVVVDDAVVRELGEDAVIGELGVLTGAPRSASVRARRDTQLLRVRPEQWQHVVGADERASRAVTVALAEQLQQGASGPGPSAVPRVISLIGHGIHVELDGLAEQLQESLRAHLHVVAPGRVNADGLERAERDADRVLLVAAAEDGEWRDFCVRQADWVVVVSGGATPPPEATFGRPTYVVLTGERVGRDQLTAWYDAAEPRRLYDVPAAGWPAVVASLAARLAGRSIGLAIAGGGARSFAAIGVLEELVAAGVEIDRLSGSSLGAVVAALFATGRDPAAVDAACYEEFVRRNPFNDYRLPTVAISRGRKTEVAMHRQLGDVLLEELPRELAVVSTDLLRRESVVHRRGSTALAVRASLALPALYPPVRIGNSLHVDGGILDNLPIAPLAAHGEGPVIAVNISGAASLSARTGPPRMPALGETLLRSLLMAGAAGLAEQRLQAAIIVTPDTRGIGLLEFHQIDRLRESGRAAGRAVVAALSGAPDTPSDVVLPRDRDESRPLAPTHD